MTFNFDEWARLAKQDKKAFERKRAKALKQAIGDCAGHNAADIRMLNGLQFKIDMTRRKHKSPMGSCIAISAMMMDQVHQLLNVDFSTILQHGKKVPHQNSDDHRVIPFKALRK